MVRFTRFALFVIAAISTTSSHAAIVRVPQDQHILQEAIDAASAGDTILLAPGRYIIDGSLEVPKRLTIASNYINSGNDADIKATIIKAAATARLQWFDLLAEATGTRIIGLTIEGNQHHSLAIRNTHSEVSHCRFVRGDDQLSFEGGGGLITHCYFENAGDDAIDADFSVSWIVEYCTIQTPNDDGIEIRLHEKEGPLTTHVARHNSFTGSTTGVQMIDYKGDSHRQIEISHNIIRNTKSTAVDCTVHTSNRNVNGSPMVEETRIFNNTIDGCLNGITMAPNLVVLNNVFTNTRTQAVVTGTYLENGHNSVVDHCLFFENQSDYDEGLHIGTNLFTFDPRYVETTSYRLSPESPAVDRGIASYRRGGVEVLKIPRARYTGKAPELGAIEKGPVR